MCFLRKISVIFFVLSMTVTVVIARPATEEEIKTLDATIQAITPGMQNDDVDTMLANMHPDVFRLIGEVTSQGMLNADQVREVTKARIQQTLLTAKTQSWSIDLAHKKPCELDNDKPCFILPLTHIIKMNGRTVKVEAPTIAVLDDNKWYFLNASEKQVLEIVQQLYPGIEKIIFDSPKVSEL